MIAFFFQSKVFRDSVLLFLADFREDNLLVHQYSWKLFIPVVRHRPLLLSPLLAVLIPAHLLLLRIPYRLCQQVQMPLLFKDTNHKMLAIQLWNQQSVFAFVDLAIKGRDRYWEIYLPNGCIFISSMREIAEQSEVHSWRNGDAVRC